MAQYHFKPLLVSATTVGNYLKKRKRPAYWRVRNQARKDPLGYSMSRACQQLGAEPKARSADRALLATQYRIVRGKRKNTPSADKMSLAEISF